MAQLIIGITGLIASGKGTAASYLTERHDASAHRFSTMLRDSLNRYHLPHTRDNLVRLSELLRQSFGQDILASTMAEDAKNDSSRLVVIEGIRRIADISHLSKLPNFLLVKIISEPKVRYQRLIIRGENEDDNTKTYEQFLKDHKLPTEATIPEVMDLATEKLDNNLEIDSLKKQLDALIARYLN
jgi:dephospho-CoA kinase